MDETSRIESVAAAIRIENLDTDQIMPKQFLRGIDKSGLDRGLFYDLRFDPQGQPREDFILNRCERRHAGILVAGANFGCGSSREHAVWGLQQAGIRAVIAPSFGEIFYSNAMNNGLLLVMLPERDVATLMDDADHLDDGRVEVNVDSMQVLSRHLDVTFSLAPRHRRMLIEGLDVIGLTLKYQAQIDAFKAKHWLAHPWMRDVADTTRTRLQYAV
jgi:3-isopropylmalate/(R)-2-methylmalate dehydratase small subunit